MPVHNSQFGDYKSVISEKSMNEEERESGLENDSYFDGASEYIQDIYEGYNSFNKTADPMIRVAEESRESLDNVAVETYELIKDFVREFGEKQSDNSIVLDSNEWHSELKGNNLEVRREDGSLMLSGDGQTFSEFNPSPEELSTVKEMSGYLSNEVMNELENASEIGM